ncbi:hypothetical protein LguiA_027950 [Lonicera macranthoides]
MGHRLAMNSYKDLPKSRAVGLMESVTTFWDLCSKRASRATKKLAPRGRSKQLFSTISNKAIPFRQKKKKKIGEEELDDEEVEGDGGLWQREILRGDKCQPLDFSGVIYYDSDGKRLSQVPMRSPRASPMPSYAYKSGKSSPHPS